MRRLAPILTLALAAACFTSCAATNQPLRVGLLERPPFVISHEDGTWSGLAVSLWEEAARAVGYETAWEPVPLDELLEGVASGRFDAAVAPLTVTAAREQRMDFSHTYHQAGLRVATRRHALPGAPATALRVLADVGLPVFVLVALTLLVGGLLVWVLERRGNSAQFGGRWYEGLGAGLWWSAATISTVGYGDKAPRTPAGRAVAVIWIFLGILVFTSFTAAVTSAVTLHGIRSAVRVPEDLGHLRVGVVSRSRGSEHLRELGHHPRQYPDLKTALATLARGDLDAVADDAPLLLYAITHEYPGELCLLPGYLERDQYAFAFPPGSELREPLNRALLHVLESPRWQETLRFHLGPEHDE